MAKSVLIYLSNIFNILCCKIYDWHITVTEKLILTEAIWSESHNKESDSCTHVQIDQSS